MSDELIRSQDQILHLTSVVNQYESIINNPSHSPEFISLLGNYWDTALDRLNLLVVNVNSFLEDRDRMLLLLEEYNVLLQKYKSDTYVSANALDELNNVIESLTQRLDHLYSLLDLTKHTISEVHSSAESLNNFALECPNEQLALFAIRAVQALHNEVVTRHIARNSMPIHWQEVHITSNVWSLINESRSILMDIFSSLIDRISWLDLPNPFNS